MAKEMFRLKAMHDHQQSASLFASTSDLTEDNKGEKRQTDPRTQQQNLDIIKHILDMFNLEETKRKYETQNVVEYVLDPNDFAYDCSLSTTRVRQRLCDLMGTDVIRLNDRRYFEKLSQRLQDEYDTLMDKHEDARMQSEHQRQRRLMLEGVIEAPDDYRSLIHGEHKVKAKKKRRQRARSANMTLCYPKYGLSEFEKTGVTIQMTTQCRTGMDETTVAPRIMDDECEARSHKEAPEVITQVEMLALPTNRQPSKSKQSTPIPRNISSAKLRFRPMAAEAEKQTTTSQYDNKTQSMDEMHVRAPPHHNGAVRSPPSGSTYESKRIKSASARLSHWDKASESESEEEQTEKGKGLHGEKSHKPFQKEESPLIKSLRQEQTVDGLYNIAAQLISPVKTEEMSRKVHAPKPKKMAFKIR